MLPSNRCEGSVRSAWASHSRRQMLRSGSSCATIRVRRYSACGHVINAVNAQRRSAAPIVEFRSTNALAVSAETAERIRTADVVGIRDRARSRTVMRLEERPPRVEESGIERLQRAETYKPGCTVGLGNRVCEPDECREQHG